VNTIASNIHPKVAAAGISAQAAALVVYAASLAGVDIPTEVALEAVAVVAFVGGYLKSS